MAGQSPDAIEALEEILGSLGITKDNILNKSTEPATSETEEMLTVPVPAVYNKNTQTMMLKSMIPDPEWFDGNKTKFEDW